MPRKDDIQGLLNERFESFEAEPQVDLWKGIEAELYPEKQRARKLWPYFSLAASIAILIFALIYLNQTPESEIQGRQIMAEEKTSQPMNEMGEDDAQHTPMLEEQNQEAQMALEENPLDAEGENTQARETTQPSKNTVNQVIESLAEPFFKKQELKDQLAEKDESVQSKIPNENDLALEINPIEKELLAVQTSKVKEPRVEQIPVQKTSDKSADKSREELEESNKLDLSDLSFKNIVSLASDGIDKIKNASPVKVYEEKDENGEAKVYKLNLFKLSVSHKTQKRRNKKVRL